MWCPYISLNGHSLVRITRTSVFMVLLQRTPVASLRSFCMRNRWYDFFLLHLFFYYLFYINIFNWQYFSYCRLWFLDVSQAQMSFLLKRIRGLFFLKLLFPWIWWIYCFLFKIHITAGWRRDTMMILRPIQILIQICGWRHDHLMGPIEIRYTNSLTLQMRTCRRPVMLQ